MFLNGPTIAASGLSMVGVLLAVPVLVRGFARRGTGVKYQADFLIQRAPQYSSLINVVCIIVSFLAFNHIHLSGLLTRTLVSGQLLLSTIDVLPADTALPLSYLGIAIQFSGFVFMIGGWYNLGEFFTTDAELLAEHKVKQTGLFGCVMHPIYSGIIQSLLGLDIVALSPLSVGVTLFLVAPLWLNRARYEEKLLLDSLGEPYRQYADEMKWRRLTPRCLPFGF